MSVCPSCAALESRDGAHCPPPPPLLHTWGANVDVVPPPAPTLACCRQCLVLRWPQHPMRAAPQCFGLTWSPSPSLPCAFLLQEGDGGGRVCAAREWKGWLDGVCWPHVAATFFLLLLCDKLLPGLVMSSPSPTLEPWGSAWAQTPFPPSHRWGIGAMAPLLTFSAFSTPKSLRHLNAASSPRPGVSQQGGEALPCPG